MCLDGLLIFQTSQAQVKVLTSEKEALQWELEVLKQKAEAVSSRAVQIIFLLSFLDAFS